MESVTNGLTFDGVLDLVLISAVVSGVVFAAIFGWFRHEQRQMQKKILEAIARAGSMREVLVLTGRETRDCGELVARFKVNKGRQVVSVLEAEGRRFIHVEGEFSGQERERMLRYLKSEGFVS